MSRSSARRITMSHLRGGILSGRPCMRMGFALVSTKLHMHSVGVPYG